MIPARSIDPLQLRILVIDDDNEVRLSLQTVLETLGYLTATAATGEAGLETLARDSYDLVICDLRLPGISGMDVLKQSGSAAPLILMTAYGNQDIATQAVHAGAFDYISKPINPDDLIFTLRKFEEFERLKRDRQES